MSTSMWFCSTSRCASSIGEGLADLDDALDSPRGGRLPLFFFELASGSAVWMGSCKCKLQTDSLTPVPGVPQIISDT